MTRPSKTLVYGGTGAQGRAIVERLLAEGNAVRVATRQTRDAAGLTGAAELVMADFEDADSLRAASAGCDRVVLLLPLMFDVAKAERWTANVVKAAAAAGAALIVLDSSAPSPAEMTGVAAIDVRIRAEHVVRNGDMPNIVLRPTIYLDNLTAPWSAPSIVAARVVAYPLPPEVLVRWTTWRDVAAFVAAAVTRPDLAGQAFDLGGVDALHGPALAAAFGRALDKEHDYAAIPLPAFEQGLNSALGAPVGTEIARLYQWFADAGASRIAADGSEAAATLGVARTPVTEWIAQQDWQQAGGTAPR